MSELDAMINAIRQAKCNGRHDGLGNPVIGVDLYLTAAMKACDEVDRLKRAATVLDERDRQDAKWGPQDHSLPEWITILMEEVGELAAAVLCHRFGNDDHPELDWRKEAIQVAAVALSIIEQYDPYWGRNAAAEAAGGDDE